MPTHLRHCGRSGLGAIVALLSMLVPARAQEPPPGVEYVREHYAKQEHLVPMRDGVKLHTAVYVPKDATRRYPILMVRTPYSVRPYGADQYPQSLGPNGRFTREGYIFVYQDVRGRFMSEGQFNDMTPHRPAKRGKVTDESSDTYDTIEWLLKHVPNHNGRVGQWGISYPGFYAAAGAIDAHPALKAVSPQAPIADWWYDDFHHWGAFFLPHAFNFMAFFAVPREGPTQQYQPIFNGHGTPDGYDFFLRLGSLKNANERYFQHRLAFWDSMVAHPNYDGFWQERNLLPHLKDIRPAVLTVGGWFDAEDLYGALNTYRAIEDNRPAGFNALVMGPWSHGGWSRSDGEALGNARFAVKTGVFYRDSIELPFFNHYLKGAPAHGLPEAYVFETGANQWRRFDAWPPRAAAAQWLYLGPDGSIAPDAAAAGSGHAAFTSDPAKPVPYTQDIAIGMTQSYMTDDQRFATRRPDVLSWKTEPVTAPLTLAGPLEVELWVSTTQQDADWVVKLIDVFPADAPNVEGLPPGVRTGGYEMMVRSEVLRGRFRDDPSRPKPFVPDQPTLVKFRLQDVLHTFQPGHRLMIHVQSTWFPLVDRNPQAWVDNIYLAPDDAFRSAEHHVYFGGANASRIGVRVLSR